MMSLDWRMVLGARSVKYHFINIQRSITGALLDIPLPVNIAAVFINATVTFDCALAIAFSTMAIGVVGGDNVCAQHSHNVQASPGSVSTLRLGENGPLYSLDFDYYGSCTPMLTYNATAVRVPAVALAAGAIIRSGSCVVALFLREPGPKA